MSAQQKQLRDVTADEFRIFVENYTRKDVSHSELKCKTFTINVALLSYEIISLLILSDISHGPCNRLLLLLALYTLF